MNLIVPLKGTKVEPLAGFLDPQGASLSVIQYNDTNQTEENLIICEQNASTIRGAYSWFEIQPWDARAAADWYSILFGGSIKDQIVPMEPIHLVCKLDKYRLNHESHECKDPFILKPIRYR